MTGEAVAIGVDLGATKIASALVSSSGQVLASRQTLTHSSEGADSVLDRLAAEIECLIHQAIGPVSGVGIGAPGVIDPLHGVIRNAVNLDWDEVHLVAGLKSRLVQPLPIQLQKDTNASALGELYFGGGQGCKDFVYFSIGSGLGGGVVANGQLITGARGSAAELGHLSLDPDGQLCLCGQRGCAEITVSGPGLVTSATSLLQINQESSSLNGLEELTPDIIVTAALKGDEIARAALVRVGTNLGIVMASCAAVLNPERFVVGGGLGLAAFEFLIPAARCELERRVTRVSHEKLEIVRSCLASSAMGAACLVWQRS
jgi:glucokinase